MPYAIAIIIFVLTLGVMIVAPVLMILADQVWSPFSLLLFLNTILWIVPIVLLARRIKAWLGDKEEILPQGFRSASRVGYTVGIFLVYAGHGTLIGTLGIGMYMLIVGTISPFDLLAAVPLILYGVGIWCVEVSLLRWRRLEQ